VATTQDEGFHEIQLNGKQLVFLFMAATVVSVVIFLCGVLVGRGVRAERGTVADSAPVNSVAETTPEPQPAASTTPAPAAGSDPRTAAPPPPVDELSYFKRLEAQNATPEQLKPSPTSGKRATAVERSAPEPAAAAVPPPPAPATPKQQPVQAVAAAAPPAPPAPKPQPVQPVATDHAAPDAAGAAYAVQIAALNVRDEAEAIAKRLTAKGYAAYVLTPSDGTPSVFRVRVGRFTTRREAESMAAKLKKEEQFNPWVTR